MSDPIDLPPKWQDVAELLSEQPPAVREMFRYAIVLAMIDDEKARVTSKRTSDNQEWLTVQTIAGDVFEIERPSISEKLEAELMTQVRAIIEEDSGR